MGETRWFYVKGITMGMTMKLCQPTKWGTTSTVEKNASFAEQARRWGTTNFGRQNTRERRSWKRRHGPVHSSTSCWNQAIQWQTLRRTSCSSSRTSPNRWWATRDASTARSSWRLCRTLEWSEFPEIASNRSSLGNVEDNTVSSERSLLWVMATMPMIDLHIVLPRTMGMSSTRTTSRWCSEMTSRRSWDMLMQRPKSAATWLKCGLECWTWPTWRSLRSRSWRRRPTQANFLQAWKHQSTSSMGRQDLPRLQTRREVDRGSPNLPTMRRHWWTKSYVTSQCTMDCNMHAWLRTRRSTSSMKTTKGPRPMTPTMTTWSPKVQGPGKVRRPPQDRRPEERELVLKGQVRRPPRTCTKRLNLHRILKRSSRSPKTRVPSLRPSTRSLPWRTTTTSA